MHTQIISGRGQLLRSLVVMLAVVVLQQALAQNADACARAIACRHGSGSR